MTPSELSSYCDAIETARRLPLIVSRSLTKESISALASQIAALPADAWQVGDSSSHSWDEHHLSAEEISELCQMHPLLEALASSATSTVGWINRFRFGAWIAPHRDAGGDLQCIIPVELPAASQGGQLWIGSPKREVPAAAGDLLLFSAASLTHGTSTIATKGERRVTINLRFWLVAGT